jgi:hypothetical protein
MRSRSAPVFIHGDGTRHSLVRVPLGAGVHDEEWLQTLIHAHPSVLPMADIEPAFADLIPAAREVPCGHGYIDNLFLTPSGDIVLVETKLWRNSQMRREVVAQALDYVAALGSMGFEEFQSAVALGIEAPSALHDLVKDHPDALAEPDFIDAVALNLRRGRLVAIVLGDGIRAETELLAGLLQSHAGAHFTFALVELGIWQAPGGGFVAVPHTLAKTVLIERGVVRVEQGRAIVAPIPPSERAGPQTISSSDFWAQIAKRDERLPGHIRALIDALEPLGIYPDLRAGISFKVDLPDRDKPLNLGYVQKNGQFWTSPVAFEVPEAIWRPYLQRLANVINGQVVDGREKYVSTNGRSAPRIEQFLPNHQAEVVGAMADLLSAIRAAGET